MTTEEEIATQNFNSASPPAPLHPVVKPKTIWDFRPSKIGILIAATLGIIISIVNLILSAENVFTGYYKPGHVWEYLTIYWMICDIVCLFLSPVVLIGVKRDKRFLVFPSACFYFGHICFSILAVLFVFMIACITSLPQALFSSMILSLLLLIVIHWFFVLYHFYKALFRSENL